jgi:hypothetical protein
MRNYRFSICLLTFFAVTGSCRKQQSASLQVTDSKLIIGQWKWVGTGPGSNSFDSYCAVPGPGQQRIITFNQDGTYASTINDSTTLLSPLAFSGIQAALPYQLHATGTYKISLQSNSCMVVSSDLSPYLSIDSRQEGTVFTISADTLQFTTPACLAPYYSNFIRL